MLSPGGCLACVWSGGCGPRGGLRGMSPPIFLIFFFNFFKIFFDIFLIFKIFFLIFFCFFKIFFLIFFMISLGTPPILVY